MMRSMNSQADEGRPGHGTVTRFEAETEVRALGEGHFEVELHPSWWIIAGPNGGYIAALLLRAMVRTVDDVSRPPRSMTVQYLRSPAEGSARIVVTVERSGRSVSNLTARMLQGDQLVALAVAAFGSARPGSVDFDESGGLAAALDGLAIPTPDDTPVIEVDPDRDVPMRSHYDLRWVVGTLPFSARPGDDVRARSGGWLRPAEQVPIDEVVLAAMADAWMPPVFSRLTEPLAVPTIDLTIHFRALPADPLGFCFVLFESPVAIDGYVVEHGRIFAPDGSLLVECRQLAVLI